MKKILLGIFIAFTLSGCVNDPIINAMTKAQTTTSSFDGSKTIKSQSMFAYSPKGKYASPLLVSGFWTDKSPDYMVIEAEIRGNYTNISDMYLNVDGKIRQIEVLKSLTKLSSPTAYSGRSSTRGFMISVDDARKLKDAKSIKIKVTTVSDGAIEADLVRDGDQSPGAKSLFNVIDQIPN